jgi:hypothetical protein
VTWRDEFHPDVGYLLPSVRFYRRIRLVLQAAGFGLIVGIAGTLAFWASTKPNQNVGPYLAADKSATAAAASHEPSDLADTAESAVALQGGQPTDRSDSFCVSPRLSTTKKGCSVDRSDHADVPAASAPVASPAWSSVSNDSIEDATQRPKKARKTTMASTRKQKPALDPSDYHAFYASPGKRHVDWADRGGFW